MGRVNLADWIDCTEVEGPGKRFALWVQGCTLCCPQCCNPNMLDLIPKHLTDTQKVIEWIAYSKAKHGIEGVTFLGGEPILQAQGLSEIAKGCREHKLSVLVFTGYTIEHLRNNPLPGVEDLLRVTDVLVDGPFISSKLETSRNWVGSTNQQFHFLTKHYPVSIEYDPAYSHGFELRISKDGTMRSNGWPCNL